MKARRVCVFCGSSDGKDPQFRSSASALGRGIAQRGLELVYGGASVGLMGVLAEATLAHRGKVVGVIPASMKEMGWAHLGLDELHIVADMHTRKRTMYSLADALIAIPGGLGTFEEIFEGMTWNQLGLHSLRYAFLNVGGYFDPILAMLRRSTDAGFIRPEALASMVVAGDPDQLLDLLFGRVP